MQWYLKSFNELSNRELYEILTLRVDVFVVEQDCIYHELDGKDLDLQAFHLYALKDERVACYLRILPPGCNYPDMPSLGRVVIHSDFRGSGIGHELMTRATKVLDDNWPSQTCYISAQSHLQGYYIKHGFSAVGDGYLEDDIPHIGMERTSNG